jgi:hypothetical protein
MMKTIWMKTTTRKIRARIRLDPQPQPTGLRPTGEDMNYAAFRWHVKHLAELHNVVLVHLPGMTIDQAAAQKLDITLDGVRGETRVVYTPEVTDAVTYSTALHEMGHLIEPSACERIPDGLSGPEIFLRKIDKEDRAWQWARTNAIVWTAEMESDARYARETYRKALEQQVKARYMRPLPGRGLNEWK